MKKIVKFGGSSLASAEQFKKVGEIIREDESRVYVVPSAPGKRFSDDTKVTDLLYKCYGAVADEEKFEKMRIFLKKVGAKRFFYDIISLFDDMEYVSYTNFIETNLIDNNKLIDN